MSHAIARLLSIQIGRIIVQNGELDMADTSLFWLPFSIPCFTLLICLSVFVSRSTSTSCSSVGGFHQSKRLRHSKLVSIPVGHHDSIFFFFLFFYYWFMYQWPRGTEPSTARPAYHSEHISKYSLLLFEIVYFSLFLHPWRFQDMVYLIKSYLYMILFYNFPEVLIDSFSGSSAMNIQQITLNAFFTLFYQ